MEVSQHFIKQEHSKSVLGDSRKHYKLTPFLTDDQHELDRITAVG